MFQLRIDIQYISFDNKNEKKGYQIKSPIKSIFANKNNVPN